VNRMKDKRRDRLIDGYTKLEYNCQYCAGYWRTHRNYWKGLGTEELSLIKLYCPQCKRTKEITW
jgi:hypothetical protein